MFPRVCWDCEPNAVQLLILNRGIETGVRNGSCQCVAANFAGFNFYDSSIGKRNSRVGDARDFRKYSLHFRNAGASRHVRHRQSNLLNCRNGGYWRLRSFGFLGTRLLLRLASKRHNNRENTDERQLSGAHVYLPPFKNFN